jgi:hypothetical protein
MSKSQFRGVVSGVEYTDRAAFEKAARDAGHRLGNNRTGDWRVGHPVRVRFRDERPDRLMTDYGDPIDGQVWCKGATRGHVIVALDGGRWARVYPGTGSVEEIDALGHTLSATGKVAA